MLTNTRFLRKRTEEHRRTKLDRSAGRTNSSEPRRGSYSGGTTHRQQTAQGKRSPQNTCTKGNRETNKLDRQQKGQNRPEKMNGNDVARKPQGPHDNRPT